MRLVFPVAGGVIVACGLLRAEGRPEALTFQPERSSGDHAFITPTIP